MLKNVAGTVGAIKLATAPIPAMSAAIFKMMAGQLKITNIYK